MKYYYYMKLDNGKQLCLIPPELITTVLLTFDYVLSLTDSKEGEEATEEEEKYFFEESLSATGIDTHIALVEDGRAYLSGNQIVCFFPGVEPSWGEKKLSDTEREVYLEALKAIREDYKVRLMDEYKKDGMRIVFKKVIPHPWWQKFATESAKK